MNPKGKTAGKILIVDDQPSVCELINSILRVDGHTCSRAFDSASAVEALNREHWDLVIADVNMPGNQDLKFVADASTGAKRVSIILITGDPSFEIASRAMELKLAGLIQKPFTPSELRRKVREVIESRHLTDALSSNPKFASLVIETRTRHTFAELLRTERTQTREIADALAVTDAGLAGEPDGMPWRIVHDHIDTLSRHLCELLDHTTRVVEFGMTDPTKTRFERYRAFRTLLENSATLLAPHRPEAGADLESSTEAGQSSADESVVSAMPQDESNADEGTSAPIT